MKTQYITLILSLLLFFNLNTSKAQLTANAGDDTILCEYGTLYLGSQPTAQDGTAPYTYAWETFYTLGETTYFASTFLNDTTASNPLIIEHLPNLESLTFKLTVTDAMSQVATDSITIVFSQYVSTLDDKVATISQGDSVLLYHGISGGVPPLTYEWSPNYNLSDNTAEFPWAKPETTTIYVCTVTDVAGCQSTIGGGFVVYVNTLGIKEINETQFTLFPNPATDEINILFETDRVKNLTIKIYDITGKLELTRNTKSFGKTAINTKDFSPGIYILSIEDDLGEVVTKKWVKI